MVHSFDILTSYVKHLSPLQGYFLQFSEHSEIFNMLFRWFKFTLKPPYSITHGKLRLAIWDTSFWTFCSNLDMGP